MEPQAAAALSSSSSSPKKRSRHREEDDMSSTSSSGSSSSDSESSDSEEHRKKKKHKKEKKSKKHKKEKKSKHKKHKKKHKKHKKKHKSEKEGAPGAIKTGYGAYGIIGPTDMYNFQAEFMAYLDEVKGMNSEEMSNGMMKAEFRSFVEDFNTATMPHEKFYGMAKFERSEALRKKKEGDKLLRKQMKAAAREGNTRFDESLLSAKRKARFEEERVAADKAELGEMAVAAREREAASMARILGLVNKSMDPNAR